MTSTLWAAPLARGGVRATVRVPGSKSMTNRALVLAALADEPTVLHHPLVSRDSELMAAAMRALGATVDVEDSRWTVSPGVLRGETHVDVGLAGTVMRFALPVAALADGPVAFDGDPRSRERPLAPLIDALRAVGAEVDDGGRGALPLTVRGKGAVRGGTVTVDASASSQLLSALLLAAPRYDDGIEVRQAGRLPGEPFVAMTVAMLRERGARVDARAGAWSVRPGALHGGDVTIEPDLSTAAPFLVAPLVAGGTMRISGWPLESLQAGAATPDVLVAMGAEVSRDGDDLVVSGDGVITGVDVDLADNPELVCVLAAVAALAKTPSRIRGIGHMRGHETDRLSALAAELGALGSRVVEDADGLVIEPAPMHGGVFHTYDDHRLAMAGAVLGLVVPDLLVENVETAGKTYPGFATRWQQVVEGGSA